VAILPAGAHDRWANGASDEKSARRLARNGGAMWEWLSDPQVQKTLGFVGGGIAAVIAGGWAVVKFVLGRPKPDGGSKSGVTITADRGGMAAGRDNLVVNKKPPSAAARRRR
jgi:hypothetical protein